MSGFFIPGGGGGGCMSTLHLTSFFPMVVVVVVVVFTHFKVTIDKLTLQMRVGLCTNIIFLPMRHRVRPTVPKLQNEEKIASARIVGWPSGSFMTLVLFLVRIVLPVTDLRSYYSFWNRNQDLEFCCVYEASRGEKNVKKIKNNFFFTLKKSPLLILIHLAVPQFHLAVPQFHLAVPQFRPVVITINTYVVGLSVHFYFSKLSKH